MDDLALKSFSVAVSGQDDAGLVRGDAIIATVGSYPKRSTKIFYRFRKRQFLSVDTLNQGKGQQRLFQMLKDPLGNAIKLEHLKDSCNPIMALAVAGPLRAALAAMAIYSCPNIKLGKLAPDIKSYLECEYYLPPPSTLSIKKSRSSKQSVKVYFKIPTAKLNVLFAALSKKEIEEATYSERLQRREGS